VRLGAAGRNAVDFALTYYLGRKAAGDSAAHYHIVSKDKGFDPLIAHLVDRGFSVCRHDDFAWLIALSTGTPGTRLREAPKPLPNRASPTPKASSVAGREERVLTHLQRHANNRPKRHKTLIRHLRSDVLKGEPEAEIEALIEKLKNNGHLRIDEKGAVTYPEHADGKSAS